jgi:hypothetical protein
MDRIIKNITDTAKAAAEGAAKAAKAASATEYIPYDEKYVKKEKQRKWQNKLNAEKAPKSNKSMADKHADTERGKRIRKAAGRKAAEAAKQAASAAAGAANESRKTILRLTESDLHRIVKESVNRIITELDWRTYYSARDKAAQQMDDPSIPKDVRDKRYDQHKKFFQAGEDQMGKQHNLNGTEVHNSMRGDYGKSFPSYTDAHIARRDRMDNLRGEYNDYANGNAQYKDGKWQ